MAEYIKREELNFLNDFRIDSGKYVGLRLDEVFDELATEDVVERSKIDKAIEQIHNERNMILRTTADFTPNEVLDVIDYILSIIDNSVKET